MQDSPTHRLVRQLPSLAGIAAAGAVSLLVTALPHAPAHAQTPQRTPDSLLEDQPSPAPVRVEGVSLLDQVIVPEQYLVGPGDQLSFQISGTTSSAFTSVISPEASVIIPSIGTVSVKGMTLAAAKLELQSRLKTYYSRAEITITLTGIRQFRVPVIGSVKRAGTQVVSASTRVSEAILTAKPMEEASMRGILLFRGADTIGVDLTVYHRLGRTDANPYLTEGDVVLVPSLGGKKHTLRVSGAVNSEETFEFREGDRVGDLIDLAFGLAPDADTTRIELWRFSAKPDSMIQVPWAEGSTLSEWRTTPLLPDDHLIVRAIDNYHEGSTVEVIGEVVRPGTYAFSGGRIALTALIDSAGGFSEEADLANARVLRTAIISAEGEWRERLKRTPEELRSQAESDWILADALSIPGRISTDFVKLFQKRDSAYDIWLSNGDLVEVPRRSVYINVIGRVVQPGRVAYIPNGRVDDYLQSAGGFAWRANRGGTFVIKGGTGAAVKKGDVKSLEPGDIVVVPTVRDRDLWKSVKDVLAVAANLATIYLVIDQATQ